MRCSAWALAAIAAVTGLAGLSVGLSALPGVVRGLVAAGVAGWGLWRGACEWRRPPLLLVVPGDPGLPVMLQGRELVEARLHWRGPVVALQWRVSRWRRGGLVLWPDLLPPALRRELRLAAKARTIPRGGRSMAP